MLIGSAVPDCYAVVMNIIKILLFFTVPRQAPGSIFTVGNGEQCLGSDRSTGGVCLSRNQCNTQGGKAIGFCGVFATCCSCTYLISKIFIFLAY